MLLFEVIRWGNDSHAAPMGGPDGPDTCFLVRARSAEQAATLVDQQLAHTPSDVVDVWSAAIYLLGTESSSQSEERILRGPYIQHAYRHGWRHWYRQGAGEPWVERPHA